MPRTVCCNLQQPHYHHAALSLPAPFVLSGGAFWVWISLATYSSYISLHRETTILNELTFIPCVLLSSLIYQYNRDCLYSTLANRDVPADGSQF